MTDVNIPEARSASTSSTSPLPLSPSKRSRADGMSPLRDPATHTSPLRTGVVGFIANVGSSAVGAIISISTIGKYFLAMIISCMILKMHFYF